MGRINSMNNEQRLIDAFTSLRFPLAVIIVVVHIYPELYAIPLGSAMEETLLYGMHQFIGATLFLPVIPLFFFMSGYFFFRSEVFDKLAFQRKIRSRIHTLLIPYLIWNTLAVLLPLFLMLPCFATINPVEQMPDFSWKAIVNSYWNQTNGIFHGYETGSAIYPQNMPLWYIRELMLIILMAPVLYRLIKYARYIVPLLGVIWLVTLYSQNIYFSNLMQGVFAFFCGGVLSVMRKGIKPVDAKSLRWIVMAYLLLSGLYICAQSCDMIAVLPIIKVMCIVVGAYCAIGISLHSMCNGNKKIIRDFLSSSSYFVFLSHGLVVGYVCKLIMMLYEPSSLWGAWMLFLMTLLLSLFLILTAYYIIRKYMPKVMIILTGKC